MKRNGRRSRAATILDLREGYFVFSLVWNQVRIADLYVKSDSPADWASRLLLTAETAAADTRVSEILTVVSTACARQALERNHFHERDRPVLILDPRSLLQGAPPRDPQSVDGDEYYLYGD